MAVATLAMPGRDCLYLEPTPDGSILIEVRQSNGVTAQMMLLPGTVQSLRANLDSFASMRQAGIPARTPFAFESAAA